MAQLSILPFIVFLDIFEFRDYSCIRPVAFPHIKIIIEDSFFESKISTNSGIDIKNPEYSGEDDDAKNGDHVSHFFKIEKPMPITTDMGFRLTTGGV